MCANLDNRCHMAGCHLFVTGHSHWVVSENISKDERLANTYDAAWVIALAIQESLDRNVTLEYGPRDKVGFQQLLSGQQFMNQLRQVKFDGISGHVIMQEDGTREPRCVLSRKLSRV